MLLAAGLVSEEWILKISASARRSSVRLSNHRAREQQGDGIGRRQEEGVVALALVGRESSQG